LNEGAESGFEAFEKHGKKADNLIPDDHEGPNFLVSTGRWKRADGVEVAPDAVKADFETLEVHTGERLRRR
jgi:hypothetical protein